MFPLFAREKYHNIDTNYKLALIRLVFSLGAAGAGTVWSLYMHSIGFSNSEVGYITGGAVLLSLALSLVSTPVLEFFRARRVFVFSLLLYVISYLFIAFSSNKFIFIILVAALATAMAFRKESFAILFRDTTSREQLPQREGLMFALVNLGWFIAPVFAGLLLARYGFSIVFLLSSGMFLVALLMVLFSDLLHEKKVFKHIDRNIFENIHKYIAREELIYPYAVRFGFNMINGFIVIYLPLFLFEKGVSPSYVGGMISLMALTHTVFDFKVGRLSERHAFKPFFIFGFTLIAVLLIVASFIQDPYILLALIPLCGVATLFIEPLQDTFFFSFLQKAKDEELLYPVYGTSTHLGGFIAKALPATVLLFAPEQFAYIAIAIVAVGIVFLLVHMKEDDVLAISAMR